MVGRYAGNKVPVSGCNHSFGGDGELEQITERVQQPLRYAAREWDPVAGLYQVRARWYDPQTGRFVSEDPIGLAGGVNPYAYAANSPINFTDPSGLAAIVQIWEEISIEALWDLLERL